MNAIETLNHLGTRLLDFALPMLVQSSLLIVALALLDRPLRNRVRAAFRYAIWLLLLVKLLLPPSFALPTGLGYWLGPGQPGRPAQLPSPNIDVHHAESPRDLLSIYETFTDSNSSPQLNRDGWLLLAWFVGALTLVGYIAWRSTLVRRLALESKPAPPELNPLLVECCEQVGTRKPIRLAITDLSMSPAVCGLWRPVILISQQLADKLSALQMRAVLLHELAHIMRGDVWVNYAQTLLQVFYWWHPLFWFANARIRRVREEAVDESVALAMGRDVDTYLATLLEIAKLTLSGPAPSLGFIGVMESKSALRERIQRLLYLPRPKSARLNSAGLLFVILGGSLLLPMARGQRPTPGRAADGTTDPTDPLKTVSPDAPVAATSKDEVAKAEDTNQIIMIEAKFIALPHRAGAEKNNASSDPALQVSKGGDPSPFLDADGVKAVLAAYASRGIQPFAAPRVTVFTGREAELSVSQSAVQDGKAVLVGAALGVAPNVKGDSVGLRLRLRMGNLSESTDPSASYPPADLFDPSSRFVLSTNITVPLGKTAILGRHVAEENAGTNYLILVTPKRVAPDNVPSKP